MNTQDRFAELWTDYLEGELDEQGLAELREMLANDDALVKLAADLFQTHRLLGAIAAEASTQQDDFIRETLSLLPENQDAFVSRVMSNVEQPIIAPVPAHSFLNRGMLVAAMLLIGFLTFYFWPTSSSIDIKKTQQSSNVHLASAAHAKFFGELSPPVGSVITPKREYVLMSGLIELSFPEGANAILEGPAVFRVLSQESLALDVGRCSVHAPEGAEGFRVETPVTRVVDRGTRFTVSVSETSETEVQVIEGMADIYDAKQIDNSETRLTHGEARKFTKSGEFVKDVIPFDQRVYRRELPDRIVSYDASKAADGGAEHLKSVTVQRDGKVSKIPVSEMIHARITWFKATKPRAFMCGNAKLPARRTDVLLDHSLVTGVINPDGNRTPLTTDPIMTGNMGTPGMAIRFDRPVKNGPGADIVFFDLQTYSNPPDGDAFHVSPLSFRNGLKSHTVRKYDLTMESPEAQNLKSFYVHFFVEAVDSLSKLDTLKCSSQNQAIKFRGLAVGIDLSDLGYGPGETVEGLFIQDALDDAHHVDPVFIAGLPEMK